MDWKKRLTKERSFFQVYWKAREVASSRWNSRIPLISVLILAIGWWVSFDCGYPVVTNSQLVTGVRAVADIGFSLTVAILGFLVAGFAIFSSITKPEVFVILAKLDHTKGAISRLQFMFFNFLFVFINFGVFLAVCIAVNLCLLRNGPFFGAVQLILSLESIYVSHVVMALFSALVGWVVFLLMLLKSFIWNLYQAVLVTIGVEAELLERGKEG